MPEQISNPFDVGSDFYDAFEEIADLSDSTLDFSHRVDAVWDIVNRFSVSQLSGVDGHITLGYSGSYGERSALALADANPDLVRIINNTEAFKFLTSGDNGSGEVSSLIKSVIGGEGNGSLGLFGNVQDVRPAGYDTAIWDRLSAKFISSGPPHSEFFSFSSPDTAPATSAEDFYFGQSGNKTLSAIEVPDVIQSGIYDHINGLATEGIAQAIADTIPAGLSSEEASLAERDTTASILRLGGTDWLTGASTAVINDNERIVNAGSVMNAIGEKYGIGTLQGLQDVDPASYGVTEPLKVFKVWLPAEDGFFNPSAYLKDLSVAGSLEALGAVGVVIGAAATAAKVVDQVQAGNTAGAEHTVTSYLMTTTTGIIGGILVEALVGLAFAALEVTPVGWVLTGAALIGGAIFAMLGGNLEDMIWSFFDGGDSSWYEHGGAMETPPRDPLVLDLGGDGLSAVALTDSNAHFDLDGNGLAEKTAWLAASDGFLVHDVNGNGVIDNIDEMFGSTTQDGFAILAQSDSNGDGVIDSNDPIFSQLQIWRDLDGDGQTDPGELELLAAAGITSINLNATPNYESLAGSFTAEASSFNMSDGSHGLISDIWFQVDPLHSILPTSENTPLNDTVLELPRLTGFGNVVDLSHSMQDSPDLLAEMQSLVSDSADLRIDQIYSRVESFLLQWTGADTAVAGSRGPSMNAEHLAFLEAVHGATYLNGPNTSAPSFAGSLALEGYYQRVMHSFALTLAEQLPMTVANLTGDNSAMDTHPLALLGTLLYDQSLSSAGITASNLFEASLERMVLQLPTNITTAQSLLPVFQAVEELQAFKVSTTVEGQSAITWLVSEIESTHTLSSQLSDLLTHIAQGQEVILGSTDDETLGSTGYSNAFIVGGAGDDTINGGWGTDTYLWARGDGNDTIIATGQSTLLLDGINAADVTLRNEGEHLFLTIKESAIGAGDGGIIDVGLTSGLSTIEFADQTLSFGAAKQVLGWTDYTGTSGDDYIGLSGGTASDNVYAGDGSDVVVTGGGDDTLLGAAGDDSLDGGSGDDVLLGGAGNDQLLGEAGNDTLTGGTGNDTLDGYTGDDSYVWSRGDGNDTVTDLGQSNYYGVTDSGNDRVVLHGVTAAEVQAVVFPFAGPNMSAVTLVIAESAPGAGDGGTIVLNYTQGIENGVTHTGIESVVFDDGTVWDRTELQNAAFHADDAGDYLVGLTGDNVMDGGAGNDTLYGQDGDDTLLGAAGDDYLTGGAGDDTFIFAPEDGDDTVWDFTPHAGLPDGDVLEFVGFSNLDFDTLLQSATEDSQGAHLHVGDDDLTLPGVHLSALGNDDFAFM